MIDLFGYEKEALFSDCKKYRFVLWRIWDNSKPKVMFIGLNPSVADEKKDDPTIRRVISFAKNWGFGGVYMLNLFTYITTYPEELLKCENPTFKSDEFLKRYALESDMIVFSWGNFYKAKERSIEVMSMFRGFVLMKNKDGSPRHPLYVPSFTKPIPA